MRLNTTLFVFIASLPPFNIAQFPLFIHNDAICTIASGRDSKITPITPIGHVSLIRSKSESNSLFISSFESGSSSFIRSLIPFTTPFILSSLNLSLLKIDDFKPSSSAFLRSASFARTISSIFAIRLSATARNALFLVSREREAIL